MIVRVALTAGPSLKASAIIPKSNGPSLSLIPYNSFHQLSYINLRFSFLEFFLESINFLPRKIPLIGKKPMMLNILTDSFYPKLNHWCLSMLSLIGFILLIFNIGAIVASRFYWFLPPCIRIDVFKVFFSYFMVAMKTYAHFLIIILKLMCLVVFFC